MVKRRERAPDFHSRLDAFVTCETERAESHFPNEFSCTATAASINATKATQVTLGGHETSWDEKRGTRVHRVS